MSSPTAASPKIRSRTIAVVTGSRADYGLLRAVIRAIAEHAALRLEVLVAGAHLLPPRPTLPEIAEEFEVAAVIPMQAAGPCTRSSESLALGRGVSGFAQRLAAAPVDFALVLGDRIEAFAAASAAAVAGIRVAHLHGGDRAEGIADESLRHAISKLAHLHFAATEASAKRLIAMGEDHVRVHITGSPAIDDLAAMRPLNDHQLAELSSPDIVLLLHPTGEDDAMEHDRAARLIGLARAAGGTLAIHPNHDAGRDGIARAIAESDVTSVSHLPRERFIGLLRRARVLLGNSSAGLIEAAAVPIWTVNVGSRQRGRERAGNVIDIEDWNYQTIDEAIRRALVEPIGEVAHPHGDGHAGQRVAELLATLPFDSLPLRKRNTY